MIAYTSGTTGKPKGAVHVHGGFLVKMASETAYQTDLHPDETLYWVTDMGWIMGPWEMVGAGCAGRDGGDVRGRARLARARPRVGVGRAPRRERARRLADADPGAEDRGRRASRQARPLEPARLRLDRRAVEPGALPLAVRGRRRAAGCRSSTSPAAPRSGACFLTPYPVEEIKVCSLGGASHGMDIDVFDPDGQPGARQGRRARLQAAVARHDPRHLGRPRALHRDLLVDVPGRLAPRRLGADRRRGRLVPARPLRRHDQRRRQAPRAGRGRVGARLAPGGRRVGGRRRARRDQGRGDLVLLRADGRRRRRHRGGAARAGRDASWAGRSSRRASCSSTRCRRRARPRSCAARCARSRSARTRATCRRPRTRRRSSRSARRWARRPVSSSRGAYTASMRRTTLSTKSVARSTASASMRSGVSVVRWNSGMRPCASRQHTVIDGKPAIAACVASVPMRQTCGLRARAPRTAGSRRWSLRNTSA